MPGYSMVSVPKGSNNQGVPTTKKSAIIIFDFDQVESFVRDDKNIKMSSFFLKFGVTPIGIFVNETSIDAGDSVEGDAYEKGFLHHVNFQHPGTDQAFAEFKSAMANANLGAIVVECDPTATTAKIYGTPCAPLKLNKADEVDTNEAHRNEVEMASVLRSEPAGIIDKNKIPVTDSSEINTLLGLSKQTLTISFPQASYSKSTTDTFDAPTATTTPKGATVAYTSSDSSVATVNGTTGAVTLVGAGTCTITATFAGNDSYKSATGSYTLTLTAPAGV